MEKKYELTREPGLTVLRLSGTPREIGLAHGTALREEIAVMRRRLISYFSSLSFGVGGRAVLWFFERVARKMEPYVPRELKQEMLGIAEGSRQGYRFIFLMNVLDDVFVNFSCSAFAVLPENSKDGRLTVGRNLDYPLFHDMLPRLNTVFKVIPDKGIPFISIAWPGFASAVTAMNNEGVFLADVSSLSRDRSIKGIPALVLNRLAVQHSASLDQLVATYAKARRTVGKNLLAASHERAVAIETSASRMSVREPDGGLLACTNHYLTPSMYKSQAMAHCPPKSGIPRHYFSEAFSRERMDRIVSLTKSRKVSVKEVAFVLGSDPVGNLATVQSAVIVPQTGSILVAARESAPVSVGNFRKVL